MPLDEKRQSSEVEEFKLTDEYKAWAANFKRVNEVTKMIEEGLRISFDETKELKRLFEEVSGKRAELLKLAPAQPVNEIEGQEQEGEERNLGAFPREVEGREEAL